MNNNLKPIQEYISYYYCDYDTIYYISDFLKHSINLNQKFKVSNQ